MNGRAGWWALGLLARVHPAVVWGVGWLAITLVAHFGHLYAGDQPSQLDWGSAVLAGFGFSSLAILVWWVLHGRE